MKGGKIQTDSCDPKSRREQLAGRQSLKSAEKGGGGLQGGLGGALAPFHGFIPPAGGGADLARAKFSQCRVTSGSRGNKRWRKNTRRQIEGRKEKQDVHVKKKNKKILNPDIVSSNPRRKQGRTRVGQTRIHTSDNV